MHLTSTLQALEDPMISGHQPLLETLHCLTVQYALWSPAFVETLIGTAPSNTLCARSQPEGGKTYLNKLEWSSAN